MNEPRGRAPAGDIEAPDQRIVLVRHAQTAWSLSGQHTGTTDLPLTDAGRAATQALRERLAGRTFARVLTSPLRRAMETCRIVGFADAAELRDDLREWDYGAYEGRTTVDIRSERPGWDLWRDGAPGGETPSEVSRRVDRVIGELDDACERGCDVLVFAHGHILAALAVRWLQLPIAYGRHLRLDTGSVSTLGWKREIRILDTWNERTAEE